MRTIPLVWTEQAWPNAECRYDHITAQTPMGAFSIEWKGWKAFDYRCVLLDGEYVGVGDTLDEAKAVAEDQFRAKILACIMDDSAGLAELVGERITMNID